MYDAETTKNRPCSRKPGRVVNVQLVRRCPHCGHVLYEKLGKCDGNIKIKCQKCGRLASMNLALRKLRR